MKRFVRIMLVVALAGVLAGTYMYVSAQDSLSGHAGMPAVRRTGDAQAAPPPVLATHVLKASYFDTSSSAVTASCSFSFCTATATVFNESIKCPVVAGKTCTFQITIESGNTVVGNSGTINEEGVYQFLVDGVAPSPGPTDGSGLYLWTSAQPIFGAVFGTSYAVTATVRNTVANQAHSITEGIGCFEVTGDASGCSATQGFSNFQIAVTTP
jgi:hypothetical protein